MTPVTPREHDKRGLYVVGLHLVEQFRIAHELPEVRYSTTKSTFGNYGVYHARRRRAEGSLAEVRLDLARCKQPVTVPGYSWSYPGYKADRTPVGVLAHEMGHHVWAYFADNFEDDFPEYYHCWRTANEYEKPLTSYEPNPEERFAEAVKLFITNPDLLRVGRSHRYGLLIHIGLEPQEDRSWREVLKHAHPRIVEAAERWIAQ